MKTHRTATILGIVLLALSVVLAGPATVEERERSWEAHRALDEASEFRGLPWRSVGPVTQGGRVVDIEVVPGKPYSFYVAFASGGLWRTTNNGMTLEPVFDEQPTMIMGDVALDPSDPERLWVGTGENNSSRSSYGGTGVFFSADAGRTWSHAGLGNTDRIGRIVVDPRDGDRVFVAALGRLYTPGGQRGVFRTEDGGKTWTDVLPGDDRTGFVDLVMHPSDPDVLYAVAWERFRRPWDFQEGGPGSGIYRTTDGGESWTRLGGGFPTGPDVGRIGVAIAPSAPDTVYAFLDNQELLPEDLWDLGDGAITRKRLRTMTRQEFLAADPEEVEDFLRGNDLDPALDATTIRKLVEDGEVTLDDLRRSLDDANANLLSTDVRGAELWRSDDAGDTWRRTHDEPIRQMVRTYGYYFGQVRVAPDDAETVYILGVPLLVTKDGGKSWTNINEPNVHVDHQAMWIDPDFPARLIEGNDGGLVMSFDGGASWLNLNSAPVGQFYTVAVDDADPYNIYGGLQDNGVWKGSSRSIPNVTPPWSPIGGGDGMYIQIDPRDGTTYWGFQFGFYFRVDPTGARKRVRPRNALKGEALRYNWQTPIQLSSHNPDIVYFGANRVFRSMDRGDNWTPISPDLTTSGKRGDVPFATITTLHESSRVFGLLWAGTDDGHVRVTRDGGASWAEVTPALAESRWVSRVESSSHTDERAYVALNGYREDDIATYLFRTEDLGRTWVDIAANLPAEAVNVVREDPVNENVVYVGTDRGAYVSLDRGNSWSALSGGLPNVPVHDMVVHPRERELVAATHGRSMWVLDVLPVQELDDAVRAAAVHVFPLESVRYERSWRARRSLWWRRPEHEPFVRIPYWSGGGSEITWSVLDEDGRVLHSAADSAVRGLNQVRWDLVLDPDLAVAAERARLAAKDEPDEASKKKRNKKDGADAEDVLVPAADMPWAETIRLGRPLYVTPGTYTVRVTSGDTSSDTELVIDPPEPRAPRTPEPPRIRGAKKDD